MCGQQEDSVLLWREVCENKLLKDVQVRYMLVRARW